MPLGLAVSDVVSVGIILAPTAAPARNFGALLIIGSSSVIDTTERIREYTSLTGVANDFGTAAPEYLAAQAFFSQAPQPVRVKIGRWAQTATNGVLHGAVQTAAQAAVNLTALQAVTTGTLNFTIDGSLRALTGLNFAAAANMNAVASVVNAALSANGTCTWDGSRFHVRSSTTGTASTVTYGTTPSGTDVSALMGVSQAAGASAPVAGIAAETAVAGLNVLTNAQADWYASLWAPLTPIVDATALLIAASIEGQSPARTVGFTTQNAATLDPTSTTDLAYMAKASLYSKTVVQYSSSNAYAVASFFGKALSPNFNGSRTTLTMKFKQEPGTIAETLTESQAVALRAKNANVFVNYQNGSAIIQEGVVASGRFWDEVHGLDWLANAAQTDLWNLLYTSTTKIPQTDEGVHTLLTQFEATLSRAVVNGLIAPGLWNAEGFGQLQRGDPLPKGFYVYAPLVSTQAQSDREARKAPLLQAAIKMAGAIHSVDTTITINR